MTALSALFCSLPSSSPLPSAAPFLSPRDPHSTFISHILHYSLAQALLKLVEYVLTSTVTKYPQVTFKV